VQPAGNALVLAFAVAACGPTAGEDDSGDGDGGQTGGTPTATSTTGVPATDDGTTSTVDPEAFCAQFDAFDSCSMQRPDAPAFCFWETIYTVSLNGGQCSVDEERGMCIVGEGEVSDPSCGTPPGCDTNPYFRVVDGVVEAVPTCGGSLPADFEPCTLVEEGMWDPPECGCLCEALGIGSSSTGGTSTATG
jgi:hypothetical protein